MSVADEKKLAVMEVAGNLKINVSEYTPQSDGPVFLVHLCKKLQQGEMSKIDMLVYPESGATCYVTVRNAFVTSEPFRNFTIALSIRGYVLYQAFNTETERIFWVFRKEVT